MLLLLLRVCAGLGPHPDLQVQVELIPCGVEHLAAAGARQE